MRTRGILLLLAGLPFWVRYMHDYNALKNSPFGDELGSIAFPLPQKLHVLGLTAIIFFLTGIFVLVMDFVRWIKKRP